MKRTKRHAAIGIGVILTIGAAAFVALRINAWQHASVETSCDQLQNPGTGSTEFAMSFTVNNRGPATVTALVFEIADRNFENRSIGETSTYTLTGPFSPGPPVKIVKEDVPAPRHWRPLKFSKLDCTLKHVAFGDDAHR